MTNAFWLPVLIRSGAACGRLYVHVQRYPKSQVRLYRHAARVQTVSSSLARTLKSILPECAERVRVIANPVLSDIGWNDEWEVENRANARERVVLYAGRIPIRAKRLPQTSARGAFARFHMTPGTEIGRSDSSDLRTPPWAEAAAAFAASWRT